MWYNILLKTIVLLIGLLQVYPVHGIIGGKETTINVHNYMVHIDIETNNGDEQCGGVLLADNIVLSAAHCFKNVNLSTVKVVAGATSLRQQGFRRNVLKVEIPKTYGDKELLSNDIALLKLDKPISPKGVKVTIEIANTDPVYNVYMKVLGWGATAPHLNAPESEILREADVMTYSREDCSKKFIPRLQENNFCAFVNTKIDACKGDSGGPLIYNGRVYGIVSRGLSCGQRNLPGIYTNIQPFRKWIIATMKKLLKEK